MRSIHDYEIVVYKVNFRKNTIILDVSHKQHKKQIIFYDVFCYKFYEKMMTVSSLIIIVKSKKALS